MDTKTNETWHNWSDLLFSYRQSRMPLEEFIREEKKVIEKNKCIDKVVSLEIARSMRTDLLETEREIDGRIMYAMNTLSEKDMKAAGLSKNELTVALLRQEHSNKKVSQILNVSRVYVWMTYQSAVVKVLNYKTMEQQERVLHTLSPQQKEIVNLIDKGKTDKEILVILGIKEGSLKSQKQRIRKKLGVTKTLNKQLQAKCAQN